MLRPKEQTINSLRADLSATRERITQLNSEKQKLMARIEAEQQHLANVRAQMDRLVPQGEIVYSDHAVIRYLERIKKMDLDAIREEIVPPAFRKMLEQLGGSGTVRVNGYKVIVRNNVVITVNED